MLDFFASATRIRHLPYVAIYLCKTRIATSYNE